MTADRWARIHDLFELCLDQPPESRASFLASQSVEPDIRSEVEKLLQQDRIAGSFLAESPDLVKELRTAPRSQFSPGDRLGHRFELLRLIGRGGMGEVYAALDVDLEEQVAIKVLHSDLLTDAGATQRFRRELQLARKVTHPNVCRLFDLGRHSTPQGDVFFLTMELIEGETLAERLRRAGPFTLNEARPIVEQLLHGLAAAHQAGIIHRDLKPSNVMLTGPRAVIMDFGLARRDTTLTEASLTSSGKVFGTLDYMAPEQLRGEPVTERTDLYALGLILYEMLTGARPFGKGDSVAGALRRLTERPPAAAKLLPEIDSKWSGLIAAALEPEAKDRPSSVQEFLDVLNGRSSPQRLGRLLRAPRSQRARLYLAGGVVAALAGAPFGWYWSRRQPTGSTSAIPTLAVLPFSTSGQDSESLGEALSDQIITNLTKYRDLKVIARGSSSRFRASSASLTSVANTLGVKYLVTGSLHLEKGRLRVSIELVDAVSNTQVWSNTFNKPRSAILSIEAEASRALVARLGLLPTAPTQTTALPAGGEAYLFGRYHMNRRVNGSLQRAVSYFEEAIRLSPDFPEAHAGLGEALIVLTEVRVDPSYIPRAQAAVDRALTLDPRLAEGHACLGYLAGAVQHDFATAERAFRRAMDLNPALVLARHWYSYHLIRLCRNSEAMAQAQKAIELDPLAMLARQSIVTATYYARDWKGVVRECALLFELDPHHPYAHILLAHAAAFERRLDDVDREIEAARQVAADPLVFSRMAAEALAFSGRPEKILPYLESLLKPNSHKPPSYVASVYAATRKADEAFAWLEKAWDAHDVFLPLLAAYPSFDSLRHDARYANLVQRLGLNYRA